MRRWLKLQLVLSALSFLLIGPVLADQPDIRVHGYLTAGVTISDEDLANYFEITDSATFNSDSIVALQVEADINDNAGATVQFLARGMDDYSVEAEWAFLQYKVSPNLQVRAGRMRLPVYMLSDYVEVGYAYPWVRPPFVVYGLVPVYAFNGADLFYKQAFGEWSVTVQPFVGASEDKVVFQGVEADLSLSSILGISFSISNDWASLHIGHARFEAGFEIPSFGVNEKDTFVTLSSLGIDAKWQNWIAKSEYTMRYTESSLSGDVNSWYLMAGYRVNSFLPYVSIGSGRNNNSEDMQTEQDGLTAGIRWDFMENIAVKLEGEVVDVKNGSTGAIT